MKKGGGGGCRGVWTLGCCWDIKVKTDPRSSKQPGVNYRAPAGYRVAVAGPKGLRASVAGPKGLRAS